MSGISVVFRIMETFITVNSFYLTNNCEKQEVVEKADTYRIFFVTYATCYTLSRHVDM